MFYRKFVNLPNEIIIQHNMSDFLAARLSEVLDNGNGITVDEAVELNDRYSADELADAADKVRRRWHNDEIDTCSIVNARSGRCSEDCKWCAQSRHHHTGVSEYDIIREEQALDAARMNTMHGIRRFSLVTSGRKVAPADIENFCRVYRRIEAETPLYLCASMGLLGLYELRRLKEAGVKRYHCNLETSASYFPSLCTTHTHADKLRTIALARSVGMEVCCGGIIGMGETMRQRLELAAEARDAGAVSIPINILNPIPGTPLESTPLISEEEIVRTAALFRMIAPRCILRFAGGRMRLSHDTMRRMLLGGVNGVLMGDMLTTVGNTVEDDKRLFAESGYRESPLKA